MTRFVGKVVDRPFWSPPTPAPPSPDQESQTWSLGFLRFWKRETVPKLEWRDGSHIPGSLSQRARTVLRPCLSGPYLSRTPCLRLWAWAHSRNLSEGWVPAPTPGKLGLSCFLPRPASEAQLERASSEAQWTQHRPWGGKVLGPHVGVVEFSALFL